MAEDIKAGEVITERQKRPPQLWPAPETPQRDSWKEGESGLGEGREDEGGGNRSRMSFSQSICIIFKKIIMEGFNTGDLVQLKSGGPVMTVSTVLEENSDSPQIRFYYIANKTKYPEAEYIYVCTWFIKDKKGNDVLTEALFPDYLLNKV